tara:strand:+ start:40 stop:1251 length:1212 start_codon:yes stop_codon:yes gene_type:complete
MYLKDVLGNKTIKQFLIKEVNENRIPHGQLFMGAKGSGKLAMAIAFSTYLFCNNKKAGDSCGSCSSCIKMFKLTHPDLHFIYPTIIPKTAYTKKVVSESKVVFPEFQKAVLKNPYLSLGDWETSLGGKNKKAGIRKNDIIIMCKLASLRSYEGVYKVFIVWGAEKMNSESNSALLKTLEEPRSNTIFILISSYHHLIFKTISSRLQTKDFKKIDSKLMLNHFKLHYPKLNDKTIYNHILNSSSNYSIIRKKLENSSEISDTYNLFIKWIRLCFLSKNKKAQFIDPDTKDKKHVIPELIEWCNNISSLERSLQINFLIHACDVFREGFLLNYQSDLKTQTTIGDLDFNMQNFSKYIQHYNIDDIFNLLNDCFYAINRYGNSKLLFLDLSFSLGKVLHEKDFVKN